MLRGHWASLASIIILLRPIGVGLQPSSDEVTVRQEQVDKNITRSIYTLNVPPNQAELIVDRDIRIESKPELRFTAWKGPAKTYSEDLSIPIGQRLLYFRALMRRFLTSGKESPSYGLLFYGYSELYQRLPELAARDSGWDRRSGRPVSGENPYKYLQSLLNNGTAYRELDSAMEEFHYRVRIDGGMENLRIFPVSKLSQEQRKNLPAGLQETDLLPARVSIDFVLTRND